MTLLVKLTIKKDENLGSFYIKNKKNKSKKGCVELSTICFQCHKQKGTGLKDPFLTFV